MQDNMQNEDDDSEVSVNIYSATTHCKLTDEDA